MRRPDFAARNPLHITQRVQPGVGYLRTQSRFEFIRRALHEASGKFGMQVVHFSIQGNHLHLIVEADGREALARSMKGLAIRLALGLNRLAQRHGAVFADRYYARVLVSPRDVANTLRYVIDNYRKHALETLPWSWEDPLLRPWKARCASHRSGSSPSVGERQSHLRAGRRSTHSCGRTRAATSAPEVADFK